MPYLRDSGRMERARSIGHVPILENVMVNERLKSFRILAPETAGAIDPHLLVTADELGVPGGPVNWLMSFDGSPQEVAVREAFPSTRVGYVQVAGVLVHLAEMLGQAREHLVDPLIIRRSTQEDLYSMVLPGSNVCRPDMATVRDSWRAEIFEIFRDYTIEGVSFLEVYLHLVGLNPRHHLAGDVLLPRCSASDSCQARDVRVPRGGSVCGSCGGRLFPTDALRIHEEVAEEHENLTALGRLMTTLEHLTMVSYILFLWKRRPQALGTVGFVLDGPLALFGPQAWLHSTMVAFMEEVWTDLRERRLRLPVVVGIEKGGQFAEHLAAIGDRIPHRNIMMLPDDYIYSHVLAFRASATGGYGRDTYYGQKFYYRTARNQLLTITVPKSVDPPIDPHRPEHYVTLPDTLAVLDRIGTSLYQDAVIPIALAHSYASIPLRTGSRVLTLMSKDLLGHG